MFRAAPRLIARSPALHRGVALPARRYISTAPPTQKSRSWKSLFARFGIAGTIIYYYNTTDVFAEEPNHPVQALSQTETESEHLPTIESITAEREKRKAVQAKLDEQRQKQALSTQEHAPQQAEGGDTSMGGLEEEAGQQGAFNPETGEINWDCPCLGGMADGPCGPEFKEAFSCFVFSEEEPKGMDCIDRFKNMQNCFREHPDVYGSEMEGEDAEDEEQDLSVHASSEGATSDHAQSESIPPPAYSDSSRAPPPKPSNPAQNKPAPKPSKSQDRPAPTTDSAPADKAKHTPETSSQPRSGSERPNLGLVPDDYKPSAEKVKDEEPTSESERLVPKGAHDAGEEGTARVGGK